MIVSMDQLTPWVQAQFKAEDPGESPHGSNSELDFLASGKGKFGDAYITQNELFWRHHSRLVRPRTAQLVKSYFKNRITQKHVTIATRDGRVLEEILVYDNNNQNFDENDLDLFLRKSAENSLVHENITHSVQEKTEAVLKRVYTYNIQTKSWELPNDRLSFDQLFQTLRDNPLPPDLTGEQKKAWSDLNIMKNIGTSVMIFCYRLARLAELSAKNPQAGYSWQDALDFKMLRNLIDSADRARDRKRQAAPQSEHVRPFKAHNQLHYELENKLITDALKNFLDIPQQDTPEHLQSEHTLLTVIETNHLIDMTDGEYGLDILSHIPGDKWPVVLASKDVTHALYTTVANAVEAQTLLPVEKSMEESSSLPHRLVAHLLPDQDNDRHVSWLNIILACALLKGLKNNLTPATAQLILKILENAHQPHRGKDYPYPSVIFVILDAFGEASLSPNIPPSFKTGAFEWCEKFLAAFKTFSDGEPDEATAEKLKNEDRQVLIKSQKIMVALSGSLAWESFLRENLRPLDPVFDPRANKQQAHNAYYKRVGSAEMMAGLAGKKRLAFRRQLDQASNEWGRDFERRIREDPIFRLDILKEAKSALGDLGETAAQKIMMEFDPEGILTRNLAFIHVLRYLYMNRHTFNPAGLSFGANGPLPEDLSTLNVKYILKQNIDAQVYESQSRAFDRWLIALQKENPSFFSSLKDIILGLSREELKLSFEVFFLEVNETETFQYYLDPLDGPVALFNFVGRIRSWTSGYHGRILTRLQAYFDQDTIRHDRQNNPQGYKKPHEYLDHYQNRITAERFFNETDGIIPYLNEAAQPSGNARYEFSEEEALHILKYFSETGFAAYLPHWLFYIIDHRFVSPDGHENLVPMMRAFEVLAASEFSRPLMEAEFERRGYLLPATDTRITEHDKLRQGRLSEASRKCLRQLPATPVRDLTHEDESETAVRQNIHSAGKKSARFNPRRTKKLITSLRSFEAKPGSYVEYQKIAKKLLRSHQMETIRAIVDEALTDIPVTFPTNAPARPLFQGPMGYLITNKKLENSIKNLAINSPSSGRGVGPPVSFTALLVRWAERNHIDLNKTFGEAFNHYQVPEEIKIIQEEIRELEAQIDKLEKSRLKGEGLREPVKWNMPDDKKIQELLELKERKERERNRKILDLAHNPATFADQAAMQIITYIYNAVRRQYLKEVLISGGEVTGELVEWYLENEVLPQKAVLMQNRHHETDQEFAGKLLDVNTRIEFLLSVLSQVEGVEYIRDFKKEQHRAGNMFF